MSQASEMIRVQFKAGDDIRDAGLTTPPDVERFDDIVYGADPHTQALDVYRPRSSGKMVLPVIVSVHGGGWVYGDKERYQFYCMDLARRGFAVVNFTYRLAPEHKFPASLEDTNLVFSWVLEHADEYGFDRGHVFAVGDSAGAHLLGLYLGLCTDPAFAELFPFAPPKGFLPAAAALNCGAYEINMSPEGMDAQLMGDLLPGGGTAEELETINVLRRVDGDFPPLFVMTATEDFLKADAPKMAAALLAAEVPFVLRFYGDKDTRLGHVFHLNIRSEAAKACNDAECAFFREYL